MFLTFKFSEEYPLFRKAFDVHVSDLNENAYDFLRMETDGIINLRKPKYRKLDKQIGTAKRMLNDYLRTNEEAEIEHLLR